MAVTTEANRLHDVVKYELDDRRSREKVTMLSGQTLSLGQVVAKILRAASAEADGGNSGDATISLGSPPFKGSVEMGDYTITCTKKTSDSAASSVVKSGTGDRDVTVSEIASTCPLGVYRATCYDATSTPTFAVYDINGNYLGDVLMDDGKVDLGPLSLTVATTGGSADYVAGDELYVEVTDTGSTQLSVSSPSGETLDMAILDVEYTGDHVQFTVEDGTSGITEGDVFTVTVEEGSGKVVKLDVSAYNGSGQAAGIAITDYDASTGDVEGVIVSRDAVIVTSGLVWPDGITETQKTTALEQLAALGILTKEEV